ncbi:uncharacterized protein LOC131949439 [Physella acuta]|uniref:uncharacterized protein LOC131949439 n=1 Tax=Physella acuta TaxID=109671 RepID=UPI0027DD2AD4|nr:uncharacterized protein LOC131949439 [Physella acuta]
MRCPAVSLLLMCLGTVLHVIGLASHQWSVEGDQSQGLWRYCVQDVCRSIPERLNTDALLICRVLALAGMFFSFVSVTLIGLAIHCKTYQYRTIVLTLLSTASSSVAFFSIVSCTTVWRTIYSVSSSIGFSFIISIIGGTSLIIGVLLFLYYVKTDKCDDRLLHV